MSFSGDVSGEMHRTELCDESIERLLSGTDVPGHEDVSMLMRQLREVYTDPAPTPVGAALAEFVDVQPAAYCGGDMSATDYLNLSEPVTPVIELSAPLDVGSTRRSAMLWKKVSASVIVAGAGVVFVASLASAESSLGDGDYTLVLPGVGEFEFTIDYDGLNDTNETVIAVRALPDDYTVDDDDPNKVAWKAWKDAASIEVEIHTDKIEGDVDWGPDGDGIATLALPGGGSITVTAPDGDGYFTVTASPNEDPGWWAFGSDSDWFVANSDDIATATEVFKVEATADGIEIKAVDGPDDGFLIEINEVEELEVEEEEELEVEVEDEDAEPGGGNENSRGRGNSDG